ncbi:MAG: protein kinase [Pseudohongiellaceae bacterium]
MKLNGYSDLIKIGEGGMALVYRGIQDSLQRPVAIKLLLSDLSTDEEARHRFEKESFIIARMNHANIIHVIDRGITEDDHPYFIMEYIPGIDLNTAMKVREISHTEKFDIIIQVLKALSYAHKNNVIHRDIKPDNILIDDEGNVKILDFGIAQFYEGRNRPSNRTSSGTVMGTYNYMSPEQQESSDNVTVQSDIYSIGVVMYGLFTGKIPTGRFPDPAELNSRIDPRLNNLILKCLNSSPTQRPKSAEELKTQLLEISAGEHLESAQRERAEQGITRIKSKFLLLDVLREDKFGAVYLYQQKEKNNLLIIKRKNRETSGFEASNLLASLEHRNIVSTLATTRNDDFFILVQEYLSGGTLQDKLAFQLNWQDTLKIGKQLCEAMIFAHNNRIVHGHLRPTNILFTPEGDVKVTDFSLQDDITDVETAHYYYLDNETRSFEGDIYAMGVILYQLFTGCLPRRRNETGFVVRKYFAKLPTDIQELITNMLSTIPENRHTDSFQKAVAIFEQHMQKRRFKSFADKPSLLKNPQSDRRKGGRGANIQGPASVLIPAKKKPKTGRVLALLALLLLVYSQYMFVFGGQEKFNKSMPYFYTEMATKIQGITGSPNAQGND